MAWLEAALETLRKYENGSGDGSSLEQDFDSIARQVPRTALARALAAAFENLNAPAADLAAELYERSSPEQKAWALNCLIERGGPTARWDVYRLLGPDDGVTAARAEAFPLDMVRRTLAEIFERDPTTVYLLALEYSRWPEVVKTLGERPLREVLMQLGMLFQE